MKFEHLDEIHTQTIGDNLWLITQEYNAYCLHERKPLLIKISAGFKTDFCTVPRLPFVYWFLGNMGKAAGLIHDALYSNYNGIHIYYPETGEPHFFDRRAADKIFLFALIYLKMPWWKCHIMYLTVRLIGNLYYKKDSQADHELSLVK